MTTDVDGNYRGVYTYDNESVERISVEDLGHVEGKPNDPLYYLKDALGTIASITNMNGEIIDSNRFAPYGEALDPVAKNARLTNSPFGYTGESHDIEGGLVYLRARYYEPDTMRFLQQDTVLGEIQNPLSLNLYAYGQGNPLTYVDPTGHEIKQAAYGETSENVRKLQNVLKAYDYWWDNSYGVTGYFGDITKYSLIRFQTSHMQLKLDDLINKKGVYVGCGPATSKALTPLENYMNLYRNNGEYPWKYIYDNYKYKPTTVQYGDGAKNWNIEDKGMGNSEGFIGPPAPQGTSNDLTALNIIALATLYKNMSATERIEALIDIANGSDSILIKAVVVPGIIVNEPQKVVENFKAAVQFQLNIGTNFEDPDMAEVFASVFTAYVTGKVFEGVKLPTKGTPKTGSLTVVEGGTYSASEMNAANYMKNLGNNVTIRPPTGQGRTSDLLVNGVKYDVYTPETSNVSQIISKMAKKNSQANGIVLDLSKTNVTPDQLSNALARVKGAVESQGKVCNINDIVIMPK